MSRDTAIFLIAALAAVLFVPFVHDLRSGSLAAAFGQAPGVREVLDGTAARRIDGHLREQSAIMRRVRPAWNEAMLGVFRETPGRVVAGRDGWLFYAPSLGPCEEPLSTQLFEDTFGVLRAIQEPLRGTPAGLLVLIVPAKWRVFSGRLRASPISAPRRRLHRRVVDRCRALGMDAPDLLAAVRREQARRAELLYPPNDSHLSQAGFGWLVSDFVAPRLAVAAAEARRRLAALPRDEAHRHAGDLVELMQVRPGSPVGRRYAFAEPWTRVGPTADVPGSDVVLLGDSFTVHYDGLLGRLIEAVTGATVDARFCDSRYAGNEERLLQEYYRRAPRLVVFVVTERRFASQE